MNKSRINIDGIPPEEVLAVAQSKEIALHLRDEAKKLAAQCGVRRCSSPPHIHFSRPGRPRKGISLPLLFELEPYLRDESCSLSDIAELFGLSTSNLRFYQRRLAIERKRGRKYQSNEMKAVV